MQKVLICLLAASTLALAVVCAVQSRQLRAVRQEARAADEARNAEVESLRSDAARAKELERANEQLQQQVQQFTKVTLQLRSQEAQQASNIAALAQQIQSPARQRGGPGGSGRDGGLFGKEMGEALGKMMKDPGMREIMREQQKTMINLMYGSLFQELNLPPEEKDKLRDLLTDAQMRNIEGAQELFGGKDGASPDDAKRSAAEAKAEADAGIKALLGEERFAVYDEYQKTIGERMQLDQFRKQLTAESQPLQDAQMAQLLQVMKEEKTALPPVLPTDQTQMPTKDAFTAENLDRQVQWMEEYNRRVLERAAQILAPDQLKQYQAFQEQQTSLQKLGLKMARQMFGGEEAPGPGAPPAEVPATR